MFILALEQRCFLAQLKATPLNFQVSEFTEISLRSKTRPTPRFIHGHFKFSSVKELHKLARIPEAIINIIYLYKAYLSVSIYSPKHIFIDKVNLS